MADSHYKEYQISKKVDVKSVVRKSFITRAQYEFQGGGAVSSGTLVLENIMGEEDIFRWDPVHERRADNPLTGRIIWSSGVKASSKVYYSAVYETFDQETALLHDPPETDGVVYHEIFLYDLDIDTLYAFQVESYDADGNSLRSETYWFHTHGEIALEDLNLQTVVELLIVVIDKSKEIDVTLVTVAAENTNLPSGTVDVDYSLNTPAALDHTQSFTVDESEFYTEIQTSVV